MESQRAIYERIATDRAAEGITIQIPRDEQLMEQLPFQQEWWDKDIGRLYDMGKEYWLTMRHQGRVYVMLGSKDVEPAPMIAANAGAAPEAAGGTEANSASAEAPDESFSPVSVRVDPMVVLEQGRTAEVNVQLDMQDGWYIYASTGRNVGQGMKETSVSFGVPDGLEAAGAVKRPPFRFKGSYDVHMGKGVTWGSRSRLRPARCRAYTK